MTESTTAAGSYEAPRIEERTKIASPLVLIAASPNEDNFTSAAFRSV